MAIGSIHGATSCQSDILKLTRSSLCSSTSLFPMNCYIFKNFSYILTLNFRNRYSLRTWNTAGIQQSDPKARHSALQLTLQGVRVFSSVGHDSILHMEVQMNLPEIFGCGSTFVKLTFLKVHLNSSKAFTFVWSAILNLCPVKEPKQNWKQNEGRWMWINERHAFSKINLPSLLHFQSFFQSAVSQWPRMSSCKWYGMIWR